MADRSTYKAARKRDNNRCVKCKCKDELHIHHIVAQSDGGTDEVDNLTLLCNSCHRELHFLEETVALDFEQWRQMPPVGALYIAMCMIDWPNEYRLLQAQIMQAARSVIRKNHD
jgi:formate-dependent nitrite reductase cytochrome c552 subunit